MGEQELSANFAFLASHDRRLAVLATAAELAFHRDPVACLVRLRQLGEVLAEEAELVSPQAPKDASPSRVPPRAERDRTTSEIATTFGRIAMIESAARSATHTHAGLDASILAAAFRGELDAHGGTGA